MNQERQIAGPGTFDACDPPDLDVAVAFQATLQPLGDLSPPDRRAATIWNRQRMRDYGTNVEPGSYLEYLGSNADNSSNTAG